MDFSKYRSVDEIWLALAVEWLPYSELPENDITEKLKAMLEQGFSDPQRIISMARAQHKFARAILEMAKAGA